MEVCLRRCPILNLTFGKAYQAVGHRGRGGEEGRKKSEEKKAPPGPVTEPYPENKSCKFSDSSFKKYFMHRFD